MDIFLYSLEMAISVWGDPNPRVECPSTEAASSVMTITQPAPVDVTLTSVETATGTIVLWQAQEIRAESTETATGIMRLDAGADAMTARGVLDDVLALWSCSCGTEDACTQRDAVAVVNGALQFIHANGRELPYLTKRRRTIQFYEDVVVYEMPADTQTVEGNVCVETFSWSQKASLISSEYDHHEYPFHADGIVRFTFTDGVDSAELVFEYNVDFTSPETLQQAIQSTILNGATCYIYYLTARPRQLFISFDVVPVMLVDFAVAGVRPWPADESFSVQQQGVGGVTSSAVSNNITSGVLVPCHSMPEFKAAASLYGSDVLRYYIERTHTPGTDSSRVRLHVGGLTDYALIGMDVAIEPARIAWADYHRGTVIPIPHRYVESLLLPIARYRATSSRRYRQRERHEALMQQYREALDMLGVVDPQTSPVKEGKEAAAP
jgi:hypothetical protein